MKYQHIRPAIFLSRPNRFIAHVLITDDTTNTETEVVCHVKNTGRCRELLLPGVRVLVEYHPQAAALGRKTEYSLIGVYKKREHDTLLINMDSQAPNQAAAEWLSSIGHPAPLQLLPDTSKYSFDHIENIRREVTYRQSRFDLSFDLCTPDQSDRKRAFMEVKGVTLEHKGIALFPDAPTERGVKHVLELAQAAENGYEAYILFVIQMKGIYEFRPNHAAQPEFGRALGKAKAAGVHILAHDCAVTEDSMQIDAPVAAVLDL